VRSRHIENDDEMKRQLTLATRGWRHVLGLALSSGLLAIAYDATAQSVAGASAPDSERARAVIEAVEKLVADVGVPGFASLEIPRGELDWIAERAVANNSNGSNPRPMDAAAYRGILDSLVAA